MSTPLDDYALIGDCETAALVARADPIGWLSWPRFDSSACSALSGSRENGRWVIECADPGGRVSRRYRPNTLISDSRIEGVIQTVESRLLVDGFVKRYNTSMTTCWRGRVV